MLQYPPADSSNAIQTMRLRDDPQPINPTTRTSRKRKSPADSTTTPTDSQQQQQQSQQQQQQQQPPPPQPPLHHVLPPMMAHPMTGGPPLPPGYYHADFTPGGIPPQPQHQGDPSQQPQPGQSPPGGGSAAGRALSSSKRAEQNRKAQRAFRERRDQHVKALESRSQLLDAALASADEANRRWEECRALVDQLRVENAALRAALTQAQLLPPNAVAPPQPDPLQQQQSNGNATNGLLQQQNNGAQLENASEGLEAVVSELKTDSAEATQEQKNE